jgi:prevent-host-death family protein
VKHKVSIYEAKTNLSKYVELVNAGDQVEITNRGRAVAELVPASSPKEIQFGLMRSLWPKWDPAELDAEVADMFKAGF